MDDADVVIVGAGLAGLRAAQVLNAAGRSVILIESANAAGGRLSTRSVDGYVLDRGFQLINSAYPELVASGVLSGFDLRYFASVVRFCDDQGTFDLGHPRRHPWRAVAALRHPDLSLGDALKLGFMMAVLRFSSARAITRGDDLATREAFRRNGVSSRAVDAIIAPFLRGTLLEDELATSWHFSALVLKSFARGRVATHPRGIAALASAFIPTLTHTTCHFNERAHRVSANSVETDCAHYSARRVIVAADAVNAHLLTGVANAEWRAQTTWWWSLPRQYDADQLRIDSRRGFLSNALDVSSVAPERAPDGRSLISANANGIFEAQADEAARTDMARLYGVTPREIELIERDVIRRALPQVRIPLNRFMTQTRHGIILAGDYLQTPSIQGALVSGRRAARLALVSNGR